MKGILSIGLKLDDVILDPEFERIVLENIRGCSRTVGILFKVVFRHVNLTEQECKDFVKRNEHLLFEVNTKITKERTDVWFYIGESGSGRYTFDGDILQGISEYLKIINHMKKRDGK
tara:strand:- start:117 stop:467 length:351 start_codon:yes stop_codon:yes gene_type:complete